MLTRKLNLITLIRKIVDNNGSVMASRQKFVIFSVYKNDSLYLIWSMKQEIIFTIDSLKLRQKLCETEMRLLNYTELACVTNCFILPLQGK
jgi:hypothetical protein